MIAADPPAPGATRRRGIGLDLMVAIGLAVILSAGWAINDWARLSHMLLPDTDDMVRLAQVRDWLGGQGINDWTQYRMAPPAGAPMHWSRINDAGIVALILIARPLVGQAQAESFAVLAYPALLFAIALFLSARIGRRLWGPEAGPIAAVLTALAYPGTTIFAPGRIDHHALQVVLIQLIVLALMHASRTREGVIAGLATALSLIVGLETAPQIAVLIAILSGFWVVRGDAERTRLAGFAGALGLTTAVFLLFLRPTLWTPAYCDAFTPASSTGTLLAAAAFGLLAAATPWLSSWRARLVAGAVLGAAILAATVIAYPSCINGPYGAVDPFLRRAFIPFIDEANGLFWHWRVERILSVGGVVAAACATGTWAMARGRVERAALLPIAAVVAMSALIMLSQVRGAYIGAPLSAPMLAGLVMAARRRVRWQLPAVILAWLASAGMAWAGVGQQLQRAVSPGSSEIGSPTPPAACSVGDTWNQVDRLKPGVTMASNTLAAYIIGATHLSTVGAGYHRNNDGNMAMYRFFLSPPERARAIAGQWKVDYVAFCPGDFGEIDVTRAYPASLAAGLQQGRAPAWLVPVPLNGTPLRFYRLVR